MANVNLFVCFFYILFSIGLIQLFKQEHYWKILLFTSVLCFSFLVGKAFVIIISIASIVYYFSFKINTLSISKWWVIGLLSIPLLIKKIFYDGNQFDTFSSKSILTADYLSIIGLSYITFNAISYLVDIKRRYIKPEQNFFKVLFYLTYFPIIFSGPLTRANYFFSKIERIHVSKESFTGGLRFILWGLFKNLVVGSRLYILMNTLISMELKGPLYLIVGFVFYLHLYCNFSSFINIFQGISIIFNIPLKHNFKSRIYSSSSRDEFWKGWHITLNEWFRDYFFYEIIRYDKKRKHVSLFLFITFICIALWHELSLTFLTWGTFNALWLIAERKFKKRFKLPYKSKFVGFLYHSLIASFLATIFISSNIVELFKTIFQFPNTTFDIQLLLNPNTYILIGTFALMDFYERKTVGIDIDKYLTNISLLSRYAFYYLLCILILATSVNMKISNYYNLF